MQTVRDIITDAYAIAGIVALGVTPKAKEMSFGLQALKDMLAAWAIEGLDIEAGALTLDTTPTFDDAYLKGVKYNLAVDLAGGPFRAEVSPRAVQIAGEQKTFIRDALLVITELTFDNDFSVRWLVSE